MRLRVYLRGGLGNQLFQYAAGLFFARKFGQELELRTDLLPKVQDSIAGISRWPIQLDSFDFSGKVLCELNQPHSSTHSLSKFLQAQRILADFFPKAMQAAGILAGERAEMPDLDSLERISLINSYCISKEPAEELGDSLRNQMRLIRQPTKEFQSLIAQAEGARPLMLHVRGGDFLRLPNLYGNTDFAAIGKLMDQLKFSSPAPVWLLTDSPLRIDKELASRLAIAKVVGPVVLNRPIEVLNLLASGSQLVCANSTLSWWAAFLSGSQSKVWFPRISRAPNNVFRKEMIIDGWEVFEA